MSSVNNPHVEISNSSQSSEQSTNQQSDADTNYKQIMDRLKEKEEQTIEQFRKNAKATIRMNLKKGIYISSDDRPDKTPPSTGERISIQEAEQFDAKVKATRRMYPNACLYDLCKNAPPLSIYREYSTKMRNIENDTP